VHLLPFISLDSQEFTALVQFENEQMNKAELQNSHYSLNFESAKDEWHKSGKHL
jgi:hypothetical protein